MSAVKATEQPAATVTVAVAVPFSPPTLHLRSFEAKSVCCIRTIRDAIKGHTHYWRVVIGIFPDELIRCVRHTVGSESLEYICRYVSKSDIRVWLKTYSDRLPGLPSPKYRL